MSNTLSGVGAAAAELPAITENTWQLCLENKRQFLAAVNYAIKCKVPIWPGLQSEEEDFQLEFWAEHLWASLAKDRDLRQVNIKEFKAMCDAYAAR